MPINVEFGLDFATSRWTNGLGGRSRIYSGNISDAPGSQIVLVGKGADNVSDAPSVADTDIYLWTREGTTGSRRRLRLATKGERITRKVVPVSGWSAGRQGEGGRGNFTYYSASVHLETGATHNPPDATDTGSSIPGDSIGGVEARRDSTGYSGAMTAGGAGDQITGHALLLFPGDIRNVTQHIGSLGPGSTPSGAIFIGRLGPGRLPVSNDLIGTIGPRRVPNDSALIGRVGPRQDIPDPDVAPRGDSIRIGILGPGTVPITVPPDPPDPDPVPDDPPGDYGLRLLIQTAPLEYTNFWSRVLRLTGQWGRRGASHLEQVAPAVMQIQLTNEDGGLPWRDILPRREVRFTDRDGATDVTLLAGYVEKVEPGYDSSTRRNIVTVHCRGALSRLADADHEVSLLLKEASLVSDVATTALDIAGWPKSRRRIERSQTRIHPAHYLRALSPVSIGYAGPVLRTLEQAEIGLLHEDRGNQVVFEHRYHREVDERIQPLYTFGDGPDAIPVIDRVEPQENWDAVFTVMSVGGSRARILTRRAVYEFAKQEGGDMRVVIDPGATWNPVIDLKRDVANRANEYVESALVWGTPMEDDYDIRRVSNNEQATGGFTVTVIPLSRTRARVLVTNLLAEPIVIRKMEIPGRGIALYGDLTVPHRERNTEIYGRRVLELPISLIGNGLNEPNEDEVKEGEHFAEMLLARYSVSRPSSRLPVNALTPAGRLMSRRIAASDPVAAIGIPNLPDGQYYVEGGDYEYQANQKRLTMGVRVSKRGVRAKVAQQRGFVSRPDDAVWQDVRPAVLTQRGAYHVASALVSRPHNASNTQSETPVLRLLQGDEVVRQWAERDIPIATADEGPSWRAGLVEGGHSIRFQIRRRPGASYSPTAIGFQVVRLDE